MQLTKFIETVERLEPILIALEQASDGLPVVIDVKVGDVKLRVSRGKDGVQINRV